VIVLSRWLFYYPLCDIHKIETKRKLSKCIMSRERTIFDKCQIPITIHKVPNLSKVGISQCFVLVGQCRFLLNLLLKIISLKLLATIERKMDLEGILLAYAFSHSLLHVCSTFELQLNMKKLVLYVRVL